MKRLLAALLLAALPAFAGTIGPSANPAEQTIGEILDAEYGAGNYTRISDDDDMSFASEPISWRWLASEAAATQDFGWFFNADDGDWILRDFAYLRGAPWVGDVFSNPALNLDGRDHMISFAVRPGVIAVGFEDWYFGFPQRTDHDFNDGVFEVTFRIPHDPPSEVPEPATGTLFSMLVIGTCLWHLRKIKT